MKKLWKYASALLALLTVAATLLGCGGKSASTSTAYATTAAASADWAVAEDSAAYYDADYDDEVVEKSSGLSGLDEASYVENDRKLIYTSNYTIETKTFDNDYNAIIAAIDTVNGFLSSENTYGTKPEVYGDSGRTARLTLRIPVDHYDAFLSAVEGVGNITAKSRSTEDVTTSYYDNEARIELYETHYEKLMNYLNNATDMEDIVTIEAEMTEVLYTIDSLKGNKRYMDDRISYCTVNISLYEVVEYTEISVSKESFGDRVKSSFTAVIKWLGRFFENFAIVFIAALPVLAVLGALFCLFFFPIRAISRRKKAKRALKAAEGQTGEAAPKAKKGGKKKATSVTPVADEAQAEQAENGTDGE